MGFALIMAVLSFMGVWVLCQLLLLMRSSETKAESRGKAKEMRPGLYWTIVAAQTLFLMVCLYQLYTIFFSS